MAVRPCVLSATSDVVHVVDEPEDARCECPIAQHLHAVFVDEVVAEELGGALDRRVGAAAVVASRGRGHVHDHDLHAERVRAQSCAIGRMASDVTEPSWHTTRVHCDVPFESQSGRRARSAGRARAPRVLRHAPSTPAVPMIRGRLFGHAHARDVPVPAPWHRSSAAEPVLRARGGSSLEPGCTSWVAAASWATTRGELAGIVLFERHRGGHEQEVGIEGVGDDRADGKRTERESEPSSGTMTVCVMRQSSQESASDCSARIGPRTTVAPTGLPRSWRRWCRPPWSSTVAATRRRNAVRS